MANHRKNMKNTALITGASSGIGLELARVHASKKGDLILVARNGEVLQNLKTELEKAHDVNVMVIAIDLTSHGAVETVYNRVLDAQIHIDVLINNAGFGDYGLFHESKWEKAESMIDLNIKVLTHLCRMVIPGMIGRGKGKIMNLASTAAFFPGPLMAVYYATKHYVLAFSESIANELEGTGVTVTAICPGPTESGFQAAAELEESKLVKGRKLPTSHQVAEFAYDAMLEGKVVAIEGFMNRMQVLSGKFAPRALLRKIVRGKQDQAL
jgi:uncharacterized protein